MTVTSESATRKKIFITLFGMVFQVFTALSQAIFQRFIPLNNRPSPTGPLTNAFNPFSGMLPKGFASPGEGARSLFSLFFSRGPATTAIHRFS